MKKTIVAALMGFAVAAVFAAPTVSLEKVQQRYPWNGKVDVSFTVSDLPSAEANRRYELVLSLLVKDNAGAVQRRCVTNVVSTFETISNVCTKIENGANALVFDGDEQYGSEWYDPKAEADLSLVELAPEYIPGPFEIIDLTGGETFPVMMTNCSPKWAWTSAKGWTDEYKTKKMVLRKVRRGVAYPAAPGETNRNLTVSDVFTPKCDYWVGVHQVTHGQYGRVMDVAFDESKATFPVNNISYNMIRSRSDDGEVSPVTPVTENSFMGILSKRTGRTGFDLPTELQWEIAARAGATDTYGAFIDEEGRRVVATADNFGECAWYAETTGQEGPWPVGMKRPNLFGLYDTAGNLWEWCLDRFVYDKTDWSSVEEPENRGDQSGRVVRGGSYYYPMSCESPSAIEHPPAWQGGGDVGFRVCRKAADAPADATGEPIGVLGNLMVIDVTDGPNAENWPVSFYNNVDVGWFNVDAYKTKKIVLREIPAGDYLCKPGSNTDLEPTDTMHVTKPYYLSVFEITEGQYLNVMGTCFHGDMKRGDKYAMGCRTSYNIIRKNYDGEASEMEPSEAVTSDSFMGRLATKTDLGTGTFDLPTEVRWEIAARANSANRLGSYINANNVATAGSESNYGEFAWYSGNNEPPGLKQVGEKRPNLWGFYDMIGNAWEWCLDRWSLNSETFLPSGATAETAYDTGKSGSRVRRSGCYKDSVDQSHVSLRNYALAHNGDGQNYDGFRLCYVPAGQ